MYYKDLDQRLCSEIVGISRKSLQCTVTGGRKAAFYLGHGRLSPLLPSCLVSLSLKTAVKRAVRFAFLSWPTKISVIMVNEDWGFRITVVIWARRRFGPWSRSILGNSAGKVVKLYTQSCNPWGRFLNSLQIELCDHWLDRGSSPGAIGCLQLIPHLCKFF